MDSRARPRNWLFKLALASLGTAFAALGALGWAEKALVFDAVGAGQASVWAFLADLHPLWPLFAVCVLGCFSAQVMAACCTVNFARLVRAHWIWRGVAAGFYVVGFVFAAYSADLGAQVVLGLPHRAAYEARENERADLTRQRDEAQARINGLDGRLLALSDAAREQGWPGERLERQAALPRSMRMTAQTQADTAQAALNSRPPIPRERTLAPWEQSVFLIFLLWAALEPWGWPLAERGRVDMPGVKRAPRPARPTFEEMLKAFGIGVAKKVDAIGQGARRAAETAAAVGAGLLVLGGATTAEAATSAPAPAPTPAPIERDADRAPASAAVELAARPSARLTAPTLAESPTAAPEPSARPATNGQKVRVIPARAERSRPTRRKQRALARELMIEGMDLPPAERRARGLSAAQVALRTGVPASGLRRLTTVERRRRANRP